APPAHAMTGEDRDMDTQRIIDAYGAVLAQIDRSSAAIVTMAEDLRPRVRLRDPVAVAQLRRVQALARSCQEKRQLLARLWLALCRAYPDLPRYPMDDADGRPVKDAEPHTGRIDTLLRRLRGDTPAR
ncbi:hypothetical protein K6L44_12725, partial [Gluconacetobacter entanii]|uniref:hypothetical protein n=2 Tax=Gluconacetobacter entanii TaxID=108528 RepID=UPI001C932FC1